MMTKTNTPKLKIWRTVWLFILLSVPFISLAQTTLNNINQNLRYSRYSRISLKVLPIQTADREFKLQMPVEKIEENSQFEDYLFSYTIVESFSDEIEEEDIIPLTQEDLKYNSERHYYFEKNVRIPEGQKEAYVIFWAKDTRQGDEYVTHMDLISPFISSHPDFGMYYEDNVPYDQTFLNQNKALLFKSNSTLNLFQYYYPTKFDIPLPPMETRPAPVPRDVEVIDKGSFLINVPTPFEELGYYFIQSDTTSQSGVMVKTVPEAYPRVSSYDEMVDMLVYISTRNEHEALREATDKKKALDRYWLELTKDTDKAKEIIREYFRQIEFANILFADFKEGWKTDRGMVYTIMGPPGEVYFDLDREVWIYNRLGSNSKITFTFARIKNIFTPNYYKLNRSRAYQPEWFKSITLWRSGKMAF